VWWPSAGLIGLGNTDTNGECPGNIVSASSHFELPGHEFAHWRLQLYRLGRVRHLGMVVADRALTRRPPLLAGNCAA
jgi:hypothetical protein